MPLETRASKVHIGDLAGRYRAGESVKELLRGLPRQLAGENLRELAKLIVHAHLAGRTVLFLYGGHVIKCGLSPLVLQWMEQGLISGLATNGAGTIHDFELALAGKTSETVEDGIETGLFGMAEETGRLMNEAIKSGAENDLGMGEALGRAVVEGCFEHVDVSVLAAAYRRGIPLSVHVAIGGDIIHQHPEADGASLGKTSYTDFERFCGLVSTLEGGVLLHFGSAVILPEVFLKALTIVRNLGHRVRDFTAANFDMTQHYRPTQNVLSRPTQSGGKPFAFTGHHEILLPLLTAAVFEELAARDER